MFKAGNPGMPIRVYFLLYDSSVEEQVRIFIGIVVQSNKVSSLL